MKLTFARYWILFLIIGGVILLSGCTQAPVAPQSDEKQKSAQETPVGMKIDIVEEGKLLVEVPNPKALRDDFLIEVNNMPANEIVTVNISERSADIITDSDGIGEVFICIDNEYDEQCRIIIPELENLDMTIIFLDNDYKLTIPTTDDKPHIFTDIDNYRIPVKFLGEDWVITDLTTGKKEENAEATPTSTPPTTTTSSTSTPLFWYVDYDRNAPGQYSEIRIYNNEWPPGPPNTAVTATISGPGVIGSLTQTTTTDAAGQLIIHWVIDQPGLYRVVVTVNNISEEKPIFVEPWREPTPACTWACGSWSECSSSSTQTRTCTSSPSLCTGTNPNPTSQTCTPTPTTTTPPPPSTCDTEALGSCLSENCVAVYGPGGSANCPEQCKINDAYDTNCLANQCNIPYQNCITACHMSNPPCTIDEVYSTLQEISGG